jgi:hypothetical protein
MVSKEVTKVSGQPAKEKPHFSEIFEVSGLKVDNSSNNGGKLHYVEGFRTNKNATEKIMGGYAVKVATTGDQVEHNMDSEAGKIIDESKIQEQMKHLEDDGKKDTVEYQLLEYRLDTRILMWIAMRINRPETPINLVQGWTDAFTEKSIDIWGRPEKELSAVLFEKQLREMASYQSQFPEEYAKFLTAAEELGLPTEAENTVEESEGGQVDFEEYAPVAEQVGQYLNEKYADVFQSMSLEQFGDQEMTPQDMVVALEKGIAKLAETDETWQQWKVIADQNKDQFNVEGSVFEITVGMKRKPATAEEFKALFSHEVLRHAMAATNGSKLDYELQKGLPKYLAWEEGVGVFFEYALRGQLPEKIINRYLDISIALGDFSDENQRQPRHKLEQFVVARERLRELAHPDSSKLDVTAHINRIYRGTRGDEHVGVMTKDFVYLGGFPVVARFIRDELKGGKTIAEVIEYINQGKFNPTIPAHKNFLDAANRKVTSGQ